MKSRDSPKRQIVFTLKPTELGTSVLEICRSWM